MLSPSDDIAFLLRQHQGAFHPPIAFDPQVHKIMSMDFSAANSSLTDGLVSDLSAFTAYVEGVLKVSGALYGVGGYAELRSLYSRSGLFGLVSSSNSASEEPRRLHLGADIWGCAGTPVHAFMKSVVHSTGYNDRFGDYGATLILSHQLDGKSFHTLYGHISKADIDDLHPGMEVSKGAVFAHIGQPFENGQWPPHLHFQVIINLGDWKGDYPGVCKWSARNEYLVNCPDPDLILQWNKYLPTRS